MNAPFYRKMEIVFWDTLIETLTNSQFVRTLIREWVAIKQSRKLGLYTTVIFMGGASGFFLGVAIPQILKYIH
jgi:hypothetical protein